MGTITEAAAIPTKSEMITIALLPRMLKYVLVTNVPLWLLCGITSISVVASFRFLCRLMGAGHGGGGGVWCGGW